MKGFYVPGVAPRDYSHSELGLGLPNKTLSLPTFYPQSILTQNDFPSVSELNFMEISRPYLIIVTQPVAQPVTQPVTQSVTQISKKLQNG